MCKTLTGTIAMSGFMFITVAAVIGCRINKKFIFNKSRLKVVPNALTIIFGVFNNNVFNSSVGS
jgi:hypothetical protein